MKFVFAALVLVFIPTGIAKGQLPTASGVPPVAAATPIAPPVATLEKRWEKFSPPGLGVTVLLPGKITFQEQLVDTPAGKKPNRVSIADLGGDVFMVSYLQFPDPVSDPAAIRFMLDRGRDGVTSKATLRGESEITLAGYSGRQWLLSLPNDMRATAKAYWVSNTFFQLLVVTNEHQTPDAAKLTRERMTKFFDSFTLSNSASN